MFWSGTRESKGSERFRRVPIRGGMAGSAEKGWKEVRLHGKGSSHLKSKWITTRRCGERRSVRRAVETLEKA
jgi:hypothetical protein